MIGWDGPFFPTWPSKMDELISLRKIKYWNQLNIEVKTLEMKSGWLLKIKKRLFFTSTKSRKKQTKKITGTKASSPGTTECRPTFHWNNKSFQMFMHHIAFCTEFQSRYSVFCRNLWGRVQVSHFASTELAEFPHWTWLCSAVTGIRSDFA